MTAASPIAARIAALQASISPEAQRELDEKFAKEKARADAQRCADLRRAAGILDRFAAVRFLDLDRDDDNSAAIDAAAAVIDSGFTLGLGLRGGVGVGKTTICCAVANAALDAGISAKFCSVAGLMDTLNSASRFSSQDDVSDLIAEYARVRVLVLDDLGREPLTRRTLPWLYELLNQRWLNRRPILLPTNYTFEALTARYVDAAQRANEDVSLAEAIVDRLSELAPLPWIPMQGRSRRGA